MVDRDPHLMKPLGHLIQIGSHQLHLSGCGQGQPTVILDAGMGDWSLSVFDLQQRVAAFPDLTCTFHARIAEGDCIVDYFTLEGTHYG